MRKQYIRKWESIRLACNKYRVIGYKADVKEAGCLFSGNEDYSYIEENHSRSVAFYGYDFPPITSSGDYGSQIKYHNFLYRNTHRRWTETTHPRLSDISREIH